MRILEHWIRTSWLNFQEDQISSFHVKYVANRQTDKCGVLHNRSGDVIKIQSRNYSTLAKKFDRTAEYYRSKLD